MDITFASTFNATSEGVNFHAVVDEKSVPCHISVQVLKNIGPTNRFSDSATLFEKNRARIEAAAERKIRAGQLVSGTVYVGTGDLL